MATPLAPRLLRRGLEVFAAISLVVFVAILFYGNNLELFIDASLSLKWGWVVLGVALASLDWFGGGIRLWVLARHVYPKSSFWGCVVAAGLNSWGGYLTPSQTGGGPVMIYAMKRAGIPLPESMISALMSFVATVVFFAVAGPVAVFLGAGQSLEQHGVLGRAVTLNDLFRFSLGGFVTIGVIMLLLIAFPGVARRIARRVMKWLETHGSARLAKRIEDAPAGIDRAHESIVAFFRGRGWISLAAAVVLTAAAQANRLLAGYIVLRALNIPAPFVDVILLQTLIVFLLYFAPTPGGSGIAEILSAAVMSIYVPRELTPSYVLLWRVLISYLTVASGSYVFWRFLKGFEGRSDAP
jgi:uncharacterized protein (TIRG00374 family)